MGNELLRVAGFISGVELSVRSVGFAMLMIFSGASLWLWWRNR